MKTEIDKNDLVIRLPMNDKPTPSKSGKTLIVASTNGFVPTTAQVDGKIVKISVNAFIER